MTHIFLKNHWYTNPPVFPYNIVNKIHQLQVLWDIIIIRTLPPRDLSISNPPLYNLEELKRYGGISIENNLIKKREPNRG